MTIIIKASKDKVPFDPERLRSSLMRVGTNEILIKKIVTEVTHLLKENMSTHEIYRIAFNLLRKTSKTMAAKYHLKRAIMQLGQSGFAFEKFIAEILCQQNFHAINNEIVTGHCINHEVDVVAKRGNQKLFVECKYHNRLGLKCDVKVSLYFKARFDDITKNYIKEQNEEIKGWLVTNTRFTQDAMQYGSCVKLHLVSWDYPKKGSLKEQIEFSGLYPITCITNFTKAEIATLLENKVVLCKTISNNTKLLDDLNIPKPRLKSIIEQCHILR